MYLRVIALKVGPTPTNEANIVIFAHIFWMFRVYIYAIYKFRGVHPLIEWT